MTDELSIETDKIVNEKVIEIGVFSDDESDEVTNMRVSDVECNEINEKTFEMEVSDSESYDQGVESICKQLVVKKFKTDDASSEEDEDDRSTSLDKAEVLLMKKGRKLREILLNPLFKNNSFTISNESRPEILNVFTELTARTIKIVNVKTAVQRIKQWKDQELQCLNFQLAIESYSLLHLISLVDIYKDLMNLGEELKADPKSGVRNVKNWVIKFARNELGIGEKKEQRFRLGCERLQILFNRGITSEQLVQAGCRRSDFFVRQKSYNIFLSQVFDP